MWITGEKTRFYHELEQVMQSMVDRNIACGRPSELTSDQWDAAWLLAVERYESAPPAEETVDMGRTKEVLESIPTEPQHPWRILTAPYSAGKQEYENYSSLFPFSGEENFEDKTVADLALAAVSADTGGNPSEHWTHTTEADANRAHERRKKQGKQPATPIALRTDLPIPGAPLPPDEAYFDAQAMSFHEYRHKPENMEALQNDPLKYVTMIMGRPMMLLVLNYPEGNPDTWYTWLAWNFRPMRPVIVMGVQGGGPLAPELNPPMSVNNAFKVRGSEARLYVIIPSDPSQPASKCNGGLSPSPPSLLQAGGRAPRNPAAPTSKGLSPSPPRPPCRVPKKLRFPPSPQYRAITLAASPELSPDPASSTPSQTWSPR